MSYMALGLLESELLGFHKLLGSPITNINHAGLPTSRPVLYHLPETFVRSV